MTHRLSIIMPAYNEGSHIFANVGETIGVLSDAGIDAELVVIDDGSSDITAAEIARAAQAYPTVIPASNPYNLGKGMALRTGFDHATGDIIVFLDADLDLHPSQIISLIEEMERGSCDVVVTSKHHPDSQLSYPFSRTIVSWGYYLFIKVLFNLPVRDTQTGLKLFRREVLEQVFHRLLVKRYAYDVELLATAVRFGFRVREIPVRLDFKRAHTWGRIKLGDVMRILTDTLAIFYRLRVLRYYDDDRPRSTADERPVLVALQGNLPAPGIVRRLALDTRTTLAVIGATDPDRLDPGILRFDTLEDLRRWLSGPGSHIAFVGLIGKGLTPLGSWTKNALRNFHDPSVAVVCGPIIPGPTETLGETAAALCGCSIVVAGPLVHLRSIYRSHHTRRASAGNCVCAASILRGESTSSSIAFRDGFIIDRASGSSAIVYDPDMAVSSPVSPLVMPYLRQVWQESFDAGRLLASGNGVTPWWWVTGPSIIALAFAAALMTAPSIAGVLAALYLAIVLIAAASNLAPVAFIPCAVGMVLDHLVHAIAAPVGIAAGILRHRQSPR